MVPGVAQPDVTKIASKADGLTFPLFFTTPDLNGNGTVAFYAQQTSDDQYGIFVGNGTPWPDGKLVKALVLADNRETNVWSSPSINIIDSQDVVAYLISCTNPAMNQIRLVGLDEFIVWTVEPQEGGPYGGALGRWGEVNNQGWAAIYGTYPGSLNGAIYRYINDINGQIELIAESWNDVYASFDSPPRINDSGQVAFTAQYKPDYNPGGGVFLYDGTGVVAVDEARNATFNSVSLNNRGDVAYIEDKGKGGRSLKAVIGGHNTIIAKENPNHLMPIASPAINDAGQVAFVALEADLVTGLYLWENGHTTCLLKAGDTLPLGTVNRIYDPIALNNAGQVAFKADIGNDTGVFRLD
jgi:hypothetical protein